MMIRMKDPLKFAEENDVEKNHQEKTLQKPSLIQMKMRKKILMKPHLKSQMMILKKRNKTLTYFNPETKIVEIIES